MHSSTTSLTVRLSLIAILMSPASPFTVAFAQEKNEAAAQDQTYTFADEKRSRTPAQRKIDSQLLYAIKQQRGETRGVPTQRIEIKLDAKGRTLVDISSAVPSRVVAKIQALDGSVVSMSQKYHTIRALMALDKLESLATSKHVRFISLPAQAMTHGGAMTQ
jgi:hypothetical protein